MFISMNQEAAERSYGATTEPEIDVEHLASAQVTTLEQGFSVEDVVLDSSSSLRDAEAGSGRFMNVGLTGVSLRASRLRGVRLRDVLAEDLDGSNSDWTGATMTRVVIRRTRLTGMQLPESELEDVLFSQCKLDYVNLRMAKLRRVSFEDCLFDDTDFAGSELDRVDFADCRIRNSELSGAKLSGVDLRSSDIGFRGGVQALRGAVITPLQLMDISAALAHEMGIEVTEG